MYDQLWNKYLPIIKILMKRSVVEDQVLDMDTTDFARAGASRKAGYKFSLLIAKGRSDDLVSSPALAKALLAALQEQHDTRELMKQNVYQINMNAKFQLGIKFIPQPPAPAPETEPAGEEV